MIADRDDYIYFSQLAKSTNRVLVILGMDISSGMSTNEIAVFDSNFNLLDRIRMPNFRISENWGVGFEAKGEYIFINSAGTQFYVIVRAHEADGLEHEYGLVVGRLD